jgi:moderate conductance mechanosensitive channel
MILAKQSGLRPAVIGALLFAILSLTAIDPACAQAVAPTDAHSTLTPAEAQRALDVLQDAGKRDDLIETLRSIVKVSAVPPTQAVPPTPADPKADVTDSADGFGADLLSEASGKLGEFSAEFEHTVRATTKFPLLWRWLTNTAGNPEAQQLLLSLLWRVVAVGLLALLTERLAQFGVRRPLAALDSRVTRDVVPTGPIAPVDANASRLSELRRALGRAPYALARLALELVPIAAFAVSAILCSPPPSARMRLRGLRSSLW